MCVYILHSLLPKAPSNMQSNMNNYMSIYSWCISIESEWTPTSRPQYDPL